MRRMMNITNAMEKSWKRSSAKKWLNIKKRKGNTLCRHGENPTDQQYEKPILNKGKSFQDCDHGRASERFLTGFKTRGQPNHAPVFAQMLLSGFSLPLTSPTFLLALKSMWRRKALSLPPLTTCRSKQITSKTAH